MRKFLLALFALPLLMLSGCNLGCQAENVISEKLAGVVASSLNCSNQGQIQADVQKVINVTHFCGVVEEVQKRDLKEGPIAMIVCPLAASTAVAILGQQIPAAWGCNPAQASAGLQGALTAACEQLPF